MKVRRAIVAGIATSLMFSALSIGGAGSASASKKASPAKVTLTWWSWTTNARRVIANFEKAYPYITVEPPPSLGVGTPQYEKLTTSLEGGTAPCIAQIEYEYLPQYLNSNDLLNISKYMSAYKKDFPTFVWNQISRKGGVYAVPEDIGPMGLMYQPAVFRKYDLVVPTTWAQFALDALKLHREDPKMYFNYFETGESDRLEGFFWQAGAVPFYEESDGTWRIDIDGPVEQRVLNFWVKLVREGAVAVADDDSPQYGHDVATDRLAAAIGAAWSPSYDIDGYLPANSTEDWAVTGLPQWTAGAHADANWGGSTNAITKDCPTQDVADAVKFALYINTSKSGLAIDEEAATAKGGGRGLFPADVNRDSVPQFLAPIPHFVGPVNAEFSKLANDVRPNFEWSPWDLEFGSEMSSQLEAAFAGKESADQVLAKVQSELVGYAKSAGYSVQG